MERGFIRSAREVINECSVSSTLPTITSCTCKSATGVVALLLVMMLLFVPLRNPWSASFVHSIGAIIVLTTTKQATREWISDIITTDGVID